MGERVWFSPEVNKWFVGGGGGGGVDIVHCEDKI